MAVTRTRQNSRKNRNNRVPAPGAGIRRSEIRARDRQYVSRPGAAEEKRTPFGVFEQAFSGEFEVELEAFGIGTSTGTIQSEKGSLLLMGRGGVLHVQITKEEGTPPWIGQLRLDDIISIEAGQTYALSTGNDSANFLRVQSTGYRESIDQLTPSIPVNEPGDVHIRREVLPDRATRTRKSSQKSHRDHIASLIEQDRNESEARRNITREVRQPRSAEAVVPQHGQQFVDPITTAMVPGVNPRPLGAAAASAMEAQAVRESMIPDTTDEATGVESTEG
jgi:hypothetical protein